MGDDSQGSNNDNALIPLADIARSIGKEPYFLSSLARAGLIKAEKRGRHWYGVKSEIERDIVGIQWKRAWIILTENMDEIINWLFGLGKICLTFVVALYIVIPFFEKEIDFTATPKVKLLLCITFVTIAYFYAAFPRALKVVGFAGNIWQKYRNLEEKLNLLEKRINLLEND